jgi:hypothetical protein
MLFVELNDSADMVKEFLPVFARLVGIGAREQALNANFGSMEKSDEAGEARFIGGIPLRGDRNIDLVDVLGFAEVAQRFGAVRRLQDRRTLPHPEAVD